VVASFIWVWSFVIWILVGKGAGGQGGRGEVAVCRLLWYQVEGSNGFLSSGSGAGIEIIVVLVIVSGWGKGTGVGFGGWITTNLLTLLPTQVIRARSLLDIAIRLQRACDCFSCQ